MRTIFAGIIMLSASVASVHAAEAQRHAQIQPGYRYYTQMQAPVDRRQPTQDEKKIDEDNEKLNLPPTKDAIIGADEVRSEENVLGTLIEQENDRLDRQLRGICRGC